MKLGTWNVARPIVRSQQSRILECLAAEALDVLVLTETHDSLLHGYAFAVRSDEGRDGQETIAGHRWVSICSRYETEALATTDSRRTAAAVIHPPSEPPFVVFGTVLPWLGSVWRGHRGPGGAAFRAALQLQADDWKSIRHHYPHSELFVLGDFNQDLVSPKYYGSNANRSELERALRSAGLIALTGGASDPVRRDAAPYACIDHICAREDSTLTLREVRRWPETPRPDRRLSDHFGVSVVIGS